MTSHPDYSAALSRIQSMSDQELQDLLNDESLCDDFVKRLDQVNQSTET